MKRHQKVLPNLSTTSHRLPLFERAFTIVELLVVIVVIGILAAITIVSYSSISSKAITALVSSDLDSNNKLLKMYNVDHGYYPNSLDSNNCPNAPDADSRYCLKSSNGTTIDYSGGGQNFVLTIAHTASGVSKQITENGVSYAIVGNGNISTFARSWNSASDYEDQGFAIDKTADGGFIVAGSVYSDATTGYDGFVSKYNVDGVLSWTKKYAKIGYDEFYSIIQTNDGGYAVVGLSDVNNDEHGDAIIAKLDSSGAISWSRAWGRDGGDSAKSIIQTSDGNFLIAGGSSSMNSENSAVFAAKYDSAGNVLWSKFWGSDSSGNSIIATNDGNYVLVGEVYYGATNRDQLVIKISPDGSKIWSKTYGSTDTEVGDKIFQTSDGGYLTVGSAGDYMNLFVTKLSSGGEVSWSKTYDNVSFDNYGLGAIQAMDGSILITTSNESVIRLLSNGDVSWANYISVDGSAYLQIANSIAQLSDGGVVAAGFIGDVDNQRDVYIAKYRIDGSIKNCISPNECGYFGVVATSKQFSAVDRSTTPLVVPSYLTTGNIIFTESSLSPIVKTIIAP